MYIQITMGQAKFHIQQTPRIINRSKVRWPEFVEVISGRSFQQFILRFFRGIHAAYDLLPWSLGRSNWYFGQSAEAELLVCYGCVRSPNINISASWFFFESRITSFPFHNGNNKRLSRRRREVDRGRGRGGNRESERVQKWPEIQTMQGPRVCHPQNLGFLGQVYLLQNTEHFIS